MWPNTVWDGTVSGDDLLPTQVDKAVRPNGQTVTGELDHVVQVAGNSRGTSQGLTVLREDGTVWKLYGDSDDPFNYWQVQGLSFDQEPGR